MTRIVVLGAGYAGILTAKKLAKMTKKMNDVEITIIDKNPFHTMLTELHEVAAWRVDEDSIKINLERVFFGRKVKILLDTITKIDFDKKEIKGENTSTQYDYLVLATGSKPAFFNVEGAQANTFTLWSYDDAVKIREHIMNMFRTASVEPDITKKRELLTFFVVGAGFTGVEMVGELAELVPSLCDRFEIDPSLVTICDVDMLDRVCTVLPPKLSAKVQKRLEKMQVNVMLKTNINAVGDDFIEYVSQGKVGRTNTRTVIWTAGVEGSDLAQASKDLGPAGRGRVQTDEYLRSANYKNVYVAGDNIFYVPEGDKGPVPQMVENAEASAHTVAHNMFSDITGTGKAEKYSPKFHGVMVCVGGRYGVAHVGTPTKKIALPSFFAMLSKHFINLLYFISVLGWNKIFSYLKHEFFTIRNCRSFLGGHFSNRGPSFFIVPLRIYLGMYWLYEGMVKLGQGWLQSPKLTGFFNGANQWYDRILGVGSSADIVALATGAEEPIPAGVVTSVTDTTDSTAAADAVASATDAAATTADTVAAATDAVTTTADTVAAATDAVTTTADTVAAATDAATAADAVAAATDAATTAVASAGDVIINWDFFGIFKAILVHSGEYAAKFQISFVDTIVNALIASDGVQIFMQSTIVIAEILIGLALIGGLFTSLSGMASIVLQCMFLTTTGLYMSSWWMLPAGFAVLFGAGQVFSLDYYVGPFLKRKLKNIKFAKKWYLYND